MPRQAKKVAACQGGDPTDRGTNVTSAMTLCGTYTLEPVADAVGFWFDLLDIDAEPCVAPYAQLFQQLLDPASTFRSNRGGANAVLLRWADLLNGAMDPGNPALLDERAAELAFALRAFEHQVPCLVLVGPADEPDPRLEHATARLRSLLAGTPNLEFEYGERLMRRYGVQRVPDPAAERFGHVPFTSQAMVALGTGVARWYAALVRPPVKVIAVDGDQTLWSGVLAEDGANGIEVSAPYASLQRALVEQVEGGRLACLLSKNDQADVHDLLERHGMPLGNAHFVARRIDWNPKPENLQAVIQELDLDLASVVFLDDNPIECAQMRASCPAVATVCVPTDTEQLAAFVEHLWLFDSPGATAEDRSRTRMYVDNLDRAKLRRGSDSLQSFLDRLELAVDIVPPSPTEVPRLAQLTQRTNQFNASLLRCDEHHVLSDAAEGRGFHRFVRASDRFGDYGIVGQVRARVDGDCLAVDLFMLSCRALARGIEHRMIAAAGEYAVSVGLREVAVRFRRGERNAPVEAFLRRVFGDPDAPAAGGESWFRMPAENAARVVFDAAAEAGATSLPEPADGAERSVPGTGDRAHGRMDSGAQHEHIALALNSAARIEQAIARRVRARPDLATGYIAPAPGLEREIATIWQEALRVDLVGSRDRFQDLGGKSMQLVRVHGLLLERLEADLDITTLFQHPTVASLASYLAARPDGAVTDAARLRGTRIRAANAGAAQRRAGGRS